MNKQSVRYRIDNGRSVLYDNRLLFNKFHRTLEEVV